jgi:GT2 family glycosyltransferase
MSNNLKNSSNKPSVKVSVLTVNYHSTSELEKCLASLQKSHIPYEVIVTDNNKHNIGYGAGINLGAKKAIGEYIFVLNPDTIIFPDTLSILVKYLDTNPGVGIAAPLLLDQHQAVYPLQGTRALTPITGIFALTFINKIFPNNPISNKYWLHDWNKKSPQKVDVVPGTAFLIRRNLFNSIGGFDPNFFLYFEESDLCRRVQKAGWETYIIPQSKLIHYWGKSTPASPQIQQIFNHSRFYYFRKHFGLIYAWIVELFCRISLRSMLKSMS